MLTQSRKPMLYGRPLPTVGASKRIRLSHHGARHAGKRSTHLLMTCEGPTPCLASAVGRGQPLERNSPNCGLRRSTHNRCNGGSNPRWHNAAMATDHTNAIQIGLPKVDRLNAACPQQRPIMQAQQQSPCYIKSTTVEPTNVNHHNAPRSIDGLPHSGVLSRNQREHHTCKNPAHPRALECTTPTGERDTPQEQTATRQAHQFVAERHH